MLYYLALVINNLTSLLGKVRGRHVGFIIIRWLIMQVGNPHILPYSYLLGLRQNLCLLSFRNTNFLLVRGSR